MKRVLGGWLAEDKNNSNQLLTAKMSKELFLYNINQEETNNKTNIIQNNTNETYMFYGSDAFIEPAIRISGHVSPFADAEVPPINDTLTILYNISRGLRSITPSFSNAFVDRHGKTFFRFDAQLLPRVNQESISNICGMADYIHMGIWDASRGVIQRVYQEYRLIETMLAYDLFNGLYSNTPSLVSGDKRKVGIIPVQLNEKEIQEALSSIETPEEALEFVEGCMICSCVRDHSQTSKDRHRGKTVDAFYMYSDAALSITDDPKEFITKDNIIKIRELPTHIKSIWIVQEDGDSMIDLLGDGEEIKLINGKVPSKKQKAAAAAAKRREERRQARQSK